MDMKKGRDSGWRGGEAELEGSEVGAGAAGKIDQRRRGLRRREPEMGEEEEAQGDADWRASRDPAQPLVAV